MTQSTIRTGNIETELPAELRNKRVALIIDRNVSTLQASLLDSLKHQLDNPPVEIVIDGGESSKTIASAQFCWDSMTRAGLDRESIVVGVGGGVITDLSGFVAACYMRGIPWLAVPTTLMGMVDASVGGKTGVNTELGKNLVGSFHQPIRVIVDQRFLTTLTDRTLRSGLAEIIKYGIISDPSLLQLLRSLGPVLGNKNLEDIVKRSISCKLAFIESDPTETKGLRAILNFGHTFGHAIETATRYQRYTHGEAVAIGMCCEARLSEVLDKGSAGVTDEIVSICSELGLPTRLDPTNIDAIISAMIRDKKNSAGQISCVLVHEIGKVSLQKAIDQTLIHQVLESSLIESTPLALS